MSKSPHKKLLDDIEEQAIVTEQERQRLLERFGPIPDETGFKNKMRIHQGWWRMNILNEEPGPHPIEKDQTVCNTIYDGESTNNNFLTSNSIKAVEEVLSNRGKESSGMMNQDRLYNNLLSSQPLCFNFFGELWADKDFGLKVLKSWWPDITELKEVFFEFAPRERYTEDNSAFDIAFEVKIGEKTGLIGIECKYTDTFSTKEYDKQAYRRIFNASNLFNNSYENYIKSRYNQLFRNQLIAEALIQNNKYDFVRTGLFFFNLKF